MFRIFEKLFLLLSLIFFCLSYSEAQESEDEICRKALRNKESACVPTETCWNYYGETKAVKYPIYCGRPLIRQRTKICCPPAPSRAVLIANEKCQNYTNIRKENNACNPIIKEGKTDAKEFPHIVRIGYYFKGVIRWTCSGSLISENFVLSTAHCTQIPKSNRIDHIVGLAAGEIESYKKPTIFKVIKHYIHEDYHSTGDWSNDIALFKLNSSIEFDKYVMPICLSTPETILPHSNEVTISGRGSTFSLEDFIIEPDNVFFNAKMIVLEKDLCEQLEKKHENESSYHSYDSSTQICTKRLGKKQIACQGSGGSAIEFDTGVCHKTQFGIVNYGDSDCDTDRLPTVSTKVSSYIEWIQKIVWPEN